MNQQETRILQSIDENEVVAFLQALIQQKSDHPPGDCRGAIDVVEQKLSESGIVYEIFSHREHQPNLIAGLPYRGNGKRLLYHAHIDTVPSGDISSWHIDPYAGKIRNSLIYGRGAGDDKGSVAAQVMAIVTLARVAAPLKGALKVAAVSDEESGGLYGTKWLHDEGRLKTDALVVGEQTNNRIAIAERVACGIDLTVFGKSAHGAMPWAGDNAVLKMARLLTWLETNYFPELADKKHLYLPPATLNIGRVSGGIQWSIVPESCKVETDRRLLPGETREDAVDELRAAIEAYNTSVEPIKFELFSTGDVAANINTPPDDPFVMLASGALSAVAGEERELTGYVQTSDGRWFASDGIPIIIFGPSDPAVAHAADEHVSITQLVKATRFLTLLALRWG